jgi:RNA polymerase sigma-70 factor (ECF subfamily)
MAASAPIPEETPAPRPEGGMANHDTPLLSPLRELELVEEFRRGNSAALAILLRAYQRRMYGICYRMVRREDDARDLTQDCMIKVMEGLPGFDSRARLSTWIIRVTMNCCISHLRKRKLRTHLSLDQPAERQGGADGLGEDSPVGLGHAMLEAGEPGPAGRVEMEETRSIVLHALNRLDPLMRAVIILRDMQDLDYVQIADVLEVPVGTVKSRLFRARTALREMIEGQMGEGESH